MIITILNKKTGVSEITENDSLFESTSIFNTKCDELGVDNSELIFEAENENYKVTLEF